MQTAINTDVFIRQVLNTLVTQMEMWDELRRQKEVEAALYMNLMNKTILAESEERQLPAEYVDDTPRVVEMFLQCLKLEKRTDATIVNYRGEHLMPFFQFLRKNYADVTSKTSGLIWPGSRQSTTTRITPLTIRFTSFSHFTNGS